MRGSQFLLSLVASLVLVFGQGVFAEDGGAKSGDAQIAQVNINTADAEALEKVLVGVGKSRAEAIVVYRDEFGPFYSAEELTAVRGIGMATVVRNQGRILVE